MSQKNRRLGRGLSSLMQSPAPVSIESPATTEQIPDKTPPATPATQSPATPSVEADGAGVRLIAVGEISPSPFQVRRVFSEEAIAQLAASIQRSGLMQPVIVRPRAGGFELVAGERRWRAARRAGLDRVPALVRDLSNEDAAEWGLVENIQREDLNPMERAHGLRTLGERLGLSAADLGQRVGLERSTVANLLRLTELEEEIQGMVSEGALSMGHARALLGAPAGAPRAEIARQIARLGLSVRAAEQACRAAQSAEGATPKETTNAPRTQRAAVVADLEKRVSASLSTRATIRMSGKGNRGRITLEFYDLEHFEDLMRRMGVEDDSV